MKLPTLDVQIEHPLQSIRLSCRESPSVQLIPRKSPSRVSRKSTTRWISMNSLLLTWEGIDCQMELLMYVTRWMDPQHCSLVTNAFPRFSVRLVRLECISNGVLSVSNIYSTSTKSWHSTNFAHFLCRVLPIMKVISRDNSLFMKLIFPHFKTCIYDTYTLYNMISALLLCFPAQVLNNLFKVNHSKVVWQCVTIFVT